MINSSVLKTHISKIFAHVAMLAFALMAMPAHAHVKWFSKVVNCVSAPLSPLAVITQPYFLLVYLAAVLVMVGVFYTEKKILHRFEKANSAAAPLKSQISTWAARLLRVGVSVYFLSLIAYSTGTYMVLTPELSSTSSWVPGVQLIIALAVLWRRTEALAAMGIVCLFSYTMFTYGWYHMMDYPYFIGVAIFLLMDATHGAQLHFLGFAALRLSAGISLLWVSAEKWMYPSWVYDILNHELRQVTMGIDTQFFVMSAGFVEFCLAFLLLFGRLSSQVCALVFLVIMCAAIPLVGTMDAVGHAPLLIALIIFTAIQNRIGYPTRENQRWIDAGHVISFAISVPGVIGLYYFGHMLAYPQLGNLQTTEALVSAGLVALLIWRIVSTMPYVFSIRKRGLQAQPVSASVVFRAARASVAH